MFAWLGQYVDQRAALLGNGEILLLLQGLVVAGYLYGRGRRNRAALAGILHRGEAAASRGATGDGEGRVGGDANIHTPTLGAEIVFRKGGLTRRATKGDTVC